VCLCLVFLKDTLAIVEEDMKTYGPFKEGERTNIPLRNAEILISDGLALSWYVTSLRYRNIIMSTRMLQRNLHLKS